MNALELRNKMNAKRPAFKAVDSYKKKRIQSKWRNPFGMHGKIRHCIAGRSAMVKAGFRGPVAARGLHRSGFQIVLVHTPAELESINIKTQGIIMARIGMRKKLAILEICKQKNIRVFNIKDIDGKVSEIKNAITERKKTKQQKKETIQQQTKKEIEKKEEKQEADKKQEQKEMEKIITKRE